MEPIYSPSIDMESEWHIIIIILETDKKIFTATVRWISMKYAFCVSSDSFKIGMNECFDILKTYEENYCCLINESLSFVREFKLYSYHIISFCPTVFHGRELSSSRGLPTPPGEPQLFYGVKETPEIY